MRTVDIKGHAGQPIQSFADWEQHALPPERKVLHWKEGRSAFELGRSWTIGGEPTVPAELVQLLESHEGTKRTVIKSGITERETTLPFVHRGPRCHDLALRAGRDDCLTTICIEGKADEPCGRTVAEELRKARQRPETSFPERLDWLTCSLVGTPRSRMTRIWCFPMASLVCRINFLPQSQGPCWKREARKRLRLSSSSTSFGRESRQTPKCRPMPTH